MDNRSSSRTVYYVDHIGKKEKKKINQLTHTCTPSHTHTVILRLFVPPTPTTTP